MLRCGCGMMIECEVKTGQTVESIENIRRKGGQLVGMQASKRWLKVGCLWNEWKEERRETVESIENIRREVSQSVRIQGSNGRLLKEGCLCNDWKE